MINCPICQTVCTTSPLCQVKWLPDVTHDLHQCPSCGIRFTAPWPTEQQFARFYHAGYYTFQAEPLEGKGWYWARYLQSLRPTGRFLDVGCATGHFIHGIRNHSSWKVAGVEISPAAAAYASDTLKLDVRRGTLLDAKYQEASFDLVHVNNVLEHVTNPLEFLRECRRILKPDGRMYLSVPHGTVDSHEYLVYAKKFREAPFNHNGHLLYFSRPALLIAFKHAGLSIDRAYTTNLKRGLKLMGWYPRKWDWDLTYKIQNTASPAFSQHVPPQGEERWKRPKAYHWWRNAKGEIFRLPGIHPVGLDLVLYLKPTP